MLYTTIRGRAGAEEASWLRGMYYAFADLEKPSVGCLMSQGVWSVGAGNGGASNVVGALDDVGNSFKVNVG